MSKNNGVISEDSCFCQDLFKFSLLIDFQIRKKSQIASHKILERNLLNY